MVRLLIYVQLLLGKLSAAHVTTLVNITYQVHNLAFKRQDRKCCAFILAAERKAFRDEECHLLGPGVYSIVYRFVFQCCFMIPVKRCLMPASSCDLRSNITLATIGGATNEVATIGS